MKRHTLMFLLLCFKFSLSQSQCVINHFSIDDSIKMIRAQKYLINKLGERFVKDSLEFSGFYQSILYMVTFEIKPQIIKNNKNMIDVFIDGNYIETKYNTKIDATDLKRYYNGGPSMNIFYNKTFAIELAQKIGLEKGIKEWEIKLSGVVDDVSWDIYSFQYEETEHPYQAGGKFLRLNINSGKYKLLKWHSIE